MLARFRCTIHGMKIDKEGEGKLTLTVPASDLPGIVGTVTGLEKTLVVTVEEEKEAT